MQDQIYTKNGDGGQTSLGGRHVPKTNSRIELIGALEETESSIGVARMFVPAGDGLVQDLAEVTGHLIRILKYLRGETARGESLGDGPVAFLEGKTDSYAAYYQGFDPDKAVMSCRTAALLMQARAVVRRAERIYIRADIAVGSKESALQRRYLNRLSDYLWAASMYLDTIRREGQPNGTTAGNAATNGRTSAGNTAGGNAGGTQSISCGSWNSANPMSLANIRVFMQALENEAAARGLSLVVAVCSREGRPVSVDVMDGAYIASYDIAVNKAWTAVSLQMPTKELAALCAPGGSLYGLQNTNQGRIVIFGGGVPLKDRDGNILGGLGVSGSTAENDTMMGDVGGELFLRMQEL